MTAVFFVGDAIEVMSKLPEKSVDLVISSPPFLALRSYLPANHPDKPLEGGSQATPGEYIDWLLDVVEACARVLAPHGSLCFELGDTYSGSGGAGGDYLNAGLRDGEPVWGGSSMARRISRKGYGGAADRLDGESPKKGAAWPLAKSLSLIPESFRWAMVYGHNPFTGRKTEPWRLRNVIRWVRPNPPVGALGDKWRPATSELMVFCKSKNRYFDLDATREAPSSNTHVRSSVDRFDLPSQKRDGNWSTLAQNDYANPAGAPPLDWWEIKENPPANRGVRDDLHRNNQSGSVANEPTPLRDSSIGAPPLDWWNIPPGGYPGAHYAVWPPELLIKPIKAMCPEKVCRTCGEPSRRIVEHMGEERRLNPPSLEEFATALIGAMKERGVTHHQVAGWLGVDEAMVRHYLGKTGLVNHQLPSIAAWRQLSDLLPFTPGLHEAMATVPPMYETPDRGNRQVKERLSGGAFNGDKPKVVPTGWSGCGCVCAQCDGRGQIPLGIHDPGPENPYTEPTVEYGPCPTCHGSGEHGWRPGLVLDPFAGSGTTLAVATGHGRDAIGIDLDERNYDLALDRVGPLVLEQGIL